ncbi:MAG: L-histidine N(alpha)-methyltransferase [Gammaproteobacteria bacterium]
MSAANKKKDDIQFYDFHPAPNDFFGEVIDGLQKENKVIPPKFFYNEQGSKIFDAICDSPEYYPTRTEIDILKNNATEISQYIDADCLLIEPGSGSSQKVRLLLDTLKPSVYMPMDISKDYLIQIAKDVSSEYSWLDVHAACIDYTDKIKLPYNMDDVHKVAFFPGSSIGNFEPADAVKFLQNIAEIVKPGGGILIGVDLKKDVETLNAAYNDSHGVTADFNLNLLTRINQELDANFDLNGFEHKAFYNDKKGRIEMHLKSKEQQTVKVGDHSISFSENETIHTENSYKYTISEFQDLLKDAGFEPLRVWTDDNDLFSVHYCNLPVN